MENKDTRILFVDIDDTLVTRKKEITPENSAAIAEALAAGHKVVISTGRPIAGTRPIINKLGLNREGCYAITFNGGLIWDCGKNAPIYKKTITLDEASHLFEEAYKDHFHVQTYDAENVLTPRDDEEVRFYCKRLYMNYKVMPDLPASIPEPPVKVLMISLKEHDRLEAFRRRISREPWAKDTLNIFFSNEWYCECVAKGISKGFAVRFMADYLGIPMENTVSAGDAENDLEMIRAAHIGCAMQNAVPELKAEADYITENDCDHSGVAEIIRKFIL